MQFIATDIEGLYEVALDVFKDNRGWFARVYCKDEFAAIGHDAEWTQINHSFTSTRGAIRGMHYQIPPFAESKLVRCISGSIFDVAVDLRRSSPTYLKWHGAELSAENKKMLYIPAGFAHGFQALSDDCELIYHHTSFYKPGSEGGFKYNDPTLNISWRLPVTEISDRDLGHPLINTTFEGIIL